MMTRKDYIAIAKVICDAHMEKFHWLSVLDALDEQRAAIAHGLADYMEQNNPNFNRSKFIEACSRVEVKATSEPPEASIYVHRVAAAARWTGFACAECGQGVDLQQPETYTEGEEAQILCLSCAKVEVKAVPSDIANLIHTLHGGDTNGN